MDDDLEGFLNALPRDFERDVRGYAQSMKEKLPEIMEQNNIRKKYQQDASEKIVYFAAIRYSWLKAKGQKILLQKTFDLAERQGISAFKRGAEIYSRSSPSVTEFNAFEERFRSLLVESEIDDIVDTDSLGDMVESLKTRFQWM